MVGPQHSDCYENNALCEQWSWSVDGALSICIHVQGVENAVLFLFRGGCVCGGLVSFAISCVPCTKIDFDSSRTLGEERGCS